MEEGMKLLVDHIGEPRLPEQRAIKERKAAKMLFSAEDSLLRALHNSLNDVLDVLCLPLFTYQVHNSRDLTPRALAISLNNAKPPGERQNLNLMPFNRRLMNRVNELFPEIAKFRLSTAKVSVVVNPVGRRRRTKKSLRYTYRIAKGL